jgi:hypothetical protein
MRNPKLLMLMTLVLCCANPTNKPDKYADFCSYVQDEQFGQVCSLMAMYLTDQEVNHLPLDTMYTREIDSLHNWLESKSCVDSVRGDALVKTYPPIREFAIWFQCGDSTVRKILDVTLDSTLRTKFFE